MEEGLSLKEIGQRIVKLRTKKGMSQAELASAIKLSRPSLTQVELGNRNLSVLELQRLAHVLHFSLDEFMSNNFGKDETVVAPIEEKRIEERISIPQLDIAKFKNVLLYVLEQCAGKPNVGETVLYKLLYFSDFNYYEIYEEHLTGAKYRKLPFGPVPKRLDNLIDQMIADQEIQRVKTTFHNYPQTRYLPLKRANLTQLKASETEIIDQVIDQMGDWSATAISEYSHKDMPWLASAEGEEIDYELAFYRESPFSARNYLTEEGS